MIKRIPFVWAEPGVDPTKQHHPLPRSKGNLKDALPWIAGLILFAAFGYNQFISPKIQDPVAQKAAMPVTTATVAVAAQPGLLSTENTAQPPTATATPTMTPTIPPTATATPSPTLPPANIVTFGVFDEGQQLACWCNMDTGEVGGENVEKCSPNKPSLCKGE